MSQISVDVAQLIRSIPQTVLHGGVTTGLSADDLEHFQTQWQGLWGTSEFVLVLDKAVEGDGQIAEGGRIG